MDAIRELLLRIKVDEAGRKPLDDVKKEISDLGSKTTQVKFDFGGGLAKANSDLDQVKSKTKEATQETDKATQSTSLLGSALSKIGSAGSSAFSSIKSGLAGVNEHINSIIGGSGLAAGALFKIAEGMEKNKNTIANLKGDKVAESWQKWADSTSNVAKSLEVAATASKILPTKMSVETQQKLAGNMYKFGKVEGIDPSELMEMIGRGNVTYFERYAKNLGLNIAQMQQRTQGMNIDQKATYLAGLLNKQSEGFKGFAGGTKTLSELEGQTTATERFSQNMAKLSQIMAEGVLPTMEFWTDKLSTGVSWLNQYPAILGTVGSLLAGLFVASSVTKMVTNVSQGAQALWTFAKAEEGVGIAGKLAFLGNPMFLALAAIAALIVYVAYRTGALQKVFEALSSVNLGKMWDQFNQGVDTAFNALDKLLGKGNIQTAFSIGISFATAPLMGIWTILKIIWKVITDIAGGMDPIKAVMEGVSTYLSDLIEIFKPAIDFLNGIFKKIGTLAKDIGDIIKGVIDLIPGMGPKAGSAEDIGLKYVGPGNNWTDQSKKYGVNTNNSGIGSIASDLASHGVGGGTKEWFDTVANEALDKYIHDQAGHGIIIDQKKFDEYQNQIRLAAEKYEGAFNAGNVPANPKGSPTAPPEAQPMLGGGKLGGQGSNTKLTTDSGQVTYANKFGAGGGLGTPVGDLKFGWDKLNQGLSYIGNGISNWGKPSGIPKILDANKMVSDTYMDAGGDITSKGRLVGHPGEQIEPANVVRGSKTVLEQLTDKLTKANPFPFSPFGQGMASPAGDNAIIINFGGVNVNVASVDSSYDVKDLAKDLTKELSFTLTPSMMDVIKKCQGSRRMG